MLIFLTTLALVCRALPSLANVEKTLFLSPAAIPSPKYHPIADNTQLRALSPTNAILRCQISATFPNPTRPKGTETWLLLKELQEQQRYEVRICWAAIVSPSMS